MRTFRGSFFFLLLLIVCVANATAQKATTQDATEEESLPDTPAVKAFQEGKAKIDKINQEIEEILAKARTLTRSDVEEIKKLQASFSEKYKQMAEALKGLRQTGLAALKDAPKSTTIGQTLLQIALGDLQSDKYADAYKMLKVLSDSGNETDGINDASTMAAFGMNNFSAAKKHLEAAIANKESRRVSSRFTVESMDQHIANWKVESEIRKVEAAKNDLPRVKLATTEGDIVIELYENEAPQAVANFVNLVEKKFYDGLIFHRVLTNFMAQGGCPDGRGSGGPGYNIYCECHKDNYRKHFAGTLSMAHAGRDTGGSQFFLTFLPTPHLDGRHTAFGRVIEGMDVLSKLKRVNPQRPSGESPSKITSATVIRKRDHEYTPTKVE